MPGPAVFGVACSTPPLPKVVRRRLRKTDAAGGPRFHDDEKLRDSDLVLNRR